MADVVLDANVLVGLLDRNDALHVAATQLVGRITGSGHTVVLLDFCLAEALSVLCRRTRERRGLGLSGSAQVVPTTQGRQLSMRADSDAATLRKTEHCSWLIGSGQ